MPRIDLAALPPITGSNYLPPYTAEVAGRSHQSLTEAGGLTQFGANRVIVPPGAWSSQRHWHSHEDEMVVMLSGELVLVEDGTETVMRAGDIACFPAGAANGHHFQNRSTAPGVFIAIGTNHPDVDECHYPDLDMHLDANGFRRKCQVVNL